MKREEFLPKAGIFSEWVQFQWLGSRLLTPDLSDFVITANGTKYQWLTKDLPKVNWNAFDTQPPF